MKSLLITILIIYTIFIYACDSWTDKKEMVLIPEGEFIMGSDDVKELGSVKKEFGVKLDMFIENEKPVQKVFLTGFSIDKFEVTNKEYKRFCSKANYPIPPTWRNDSYPEGKAMHPVNNVTWFDADAYCNWLGKRLPTEEEWEKAARGTDGKHRYTWGDEFDVTKANLNKGETMRVGSMPEDVSVYGIYDMAGNVMEWTGSWYKPFPGSTKKSKDYGEINRVIRGWAGTDSGHYNLPYIFARTSARHFYLPNGMGDDIGFRCAK